MHEAATQKPGVAAKARRAQALAAARGSQAEQARLDADVAKDRCVSAAHPPNFCAPRVPAAALKVVMKPRAGHGESVSLGSTRSVERPRSGWTADVGAGVLVGSEENRRLSGKADMDSFFNSINKEEQSIRASKSGLSTLPGAVKKARTTTLLRSRTAKKGGLEQSGTQQWGKVFNPMMPSGRKGNADMTPQGTKEFNTYAHEATMYNNVHGTLPSPAAAAARIQHPHRTSRANADPAKDGHDDTHGNWWAAGMPSSHGRSDQWWEHKAHKKGYFA
jgi:hypothetical protein